MYKKILVPLDGSGFGEQALTHLAALSAPQSTELSLLSVVGTEMYVPAYEPIHVNQTLLPMIQHDLESYLQKKAGELQAAGWKVTTQLLFGDAASAIASTAQEQHVDLIAMTTHGRTGLKRMFLGSVADRVMRTVTQPVFLVRPLATSTGEAAPPPYQIRRILVPLDGSELAETALASAEQIAKEQGASLLLVRAILPPLADERELYFANESTVLNIQRQMTALANQYLERLQLRLKLAGIDATYSCESGPAADVILSIANAQQVDLIAISSHGRSGVNRWVYGSVANQVLHDALCPLLMLRGVQRERVPELAMVPNVVPSTSGVTA